MPDVEVHGASEPMLGGSSKGDSIKAVRITGKTKEEKTRIVAEVRRPKCPSPVPLPLGQWRKQQQREPQRIVEREDPESTPDIEVPEAMWRVLAVVENAGNQEP